MHNGPPKKKENSCNIPRGGVNLVRFNVCVKCGHVISPVHNQGRHSRSVVASVQERDRASNCSVRGVLTTMGAPNFLRQNPVEESPVERIFGVSWTVVLYNSWSLGGSGGGVSCP